VRLLLRRQDRGVDPDRGAGEVTELGELLEALALGHALARPGAAGGLRLVGVCVVAGTTGQHETGHGHGGHGTDSDLA
jgi:hypothetical protein